MKRIYLKLGKRHRKFVITAAERMPRVGDLCTMDGQDWEVTRIEDAKVLATFECRGLRLRQVFP